ncbi:hypothetical protein QN345_20240, partial [Cryobacterium sp. 10I1]|nr:hypothetical protein [Cryobacterium sp. 10I1]
MPPASAAENHAATTAPTNPVGAVVDHALELAPLVDGHNDWAWECRENRAYSVEGLERGLT